jgi:uncharacterized protein DUF6445
MNPTPFAARGDFTVERIDVGAEGAPVLIIDRLMADPSQLVAFADRASDFRALAQAGNFYPGVRAPAPQPYVQSLFEAVRGPIAEAFGLSGLPRRLTCAYSMTTVSPDVLTPAQRAPHFDTSDAGQIAVLHYLFDPPHGGTSFYRHRATGWESITPDRAGPYAALLRAELDERPPPAAYTTGDTELFEHVTRIRPSFDRLIVYRGRMLHSGDIDPARDLDPSPRTGRLTLNTFIDFDENA